MSYCRGKVYAYCGGDFICISNHAGYWIHWPDGYEGEDEMVFYFPDSPYGGDPVTTMTFPDLESFRQHIEAHRLEFDRLSEEMTEVMHHIVEDQQASKERKDEYEECSVVWRRLEDLAPAKHPTQCSCQGSGFIQESE